VERHGAGSLQQLVATYAPEDVVRRTIITGSERVRFADPTPYAGDVAVLKASGANVLAAELVATASALGARVRLSPGNARGALWAAVTAARLDAAIWEVDARPDGRLAVREVPGPADS